MPFSRTFLSTRTLAAFLVSAFTTISQSADPSPQPWPEPDISLVVMDPLAAPLSCPCVDGYAQRKYEKLAEHLELQTGRTVHLCFSESVQTALKGPARGRADVIVGKDSVVRHDAKNAGQEIVPVARLTDKQGKTTQTGLIVVPSSDLAQKPEDLAGYRIVFGPADCDEKYTAARELLVGAGVQLPAKEETSKACSDGACTILEWGEQVRGAAVISSYAKPLLEGCGTIQKGDLRVIAETKPVPFITAFVAKPMAVAKQRAIVDALLQVGDDPELCLALESLLGFVAIDEPNATLAAKKK